MLLLSSVTAFINGSAQKHARKCKGVCPKSEALCGKTIMSSYIGHSAKGKPLLMERYIQMLERKVKYFRLLH